MGATVARLSSPETTHIAGLKSLAGIGKFVFTTVGAG
jgi:hypothetical protein